MNQPAIHLLDVSRSHRMGSKAITVLDQANLIVSPGEAVAIIGPSGAGKSTLLSLIAGLDRPTSGRVSVGGIDLTAAKPQQLAQFRFERVGFIFQQYHLIPTLTAIENVVLPCAPWRTEYPPRKRAAELLGLVGLDDRQHHLPAQLSGGEQQRVSIARALINHPSILLADEPTGNLDEESAAEVMRLIRSLAEQFQMTLVVVTHDQELARTSDRVILLKNGKLSLKLSGPVISDRHTVAEARPHSDPD